MNSINFLFTVLAFCLVQHSHSQSVTFYSKRNYSGSTHTLLINQSAILKCFDESPSFIVGNGAAIKISFVDQFENYPYLFIYSESSAKRIGGTSQYGTRNIDEHFSGRDLLVECLVAGSYPQPTGFIPIDKNNVNGGVASLGDPGDEVLVLKKAYFWENSEDLGCFHGPWARIVARIFPTSLLNSYNFDFQAISEDYCEEPIPNCINCCNFLWANQPFGNNGNKIPGPVWSSQSTCTFAPAPESEWIDGPWGACYSNISLFNWTDNPGVNEIYVLVREGDVTDTDDFLGGGVISRNTQKTTILCWHFGWIEVEKITIPPSGHEESVDVADFFWFNQWDGIYPDDDAAINPNFTLNSNGVPVPPSLPYLFDQYLPLSNKSIDEMENVFFEGSTIGLIGGKFPSGVLDRPMIYKASCKPAIFGQQ